MSWFLLILSGLLEAVWAIALSRIDGLHSRIPITVFIVGLTLSMAGLALALRDLPLGTAYAVWVGIGATATVVYSMATGAEPFSVVRMLLVAGIIGCVIGLKLTH